MTTNLLPDRQWELPEIDHDLRERLKEEIRRWGRVLVPIVVDEHDRIIDGEIRQQLAQELGIKDIPRVIVPGLTEEEKHDLRLVLNIYRRHLNREQVRQWVAWELIVHPDHSDRKVAAKIGVSPTTVGKVRATVQVGQSAPRLGADGNYRRRPAVYTSHDRGTKQAQEILKSLDSAPGDLNLSLRELRRLRREQERSEKFAAAKPVTLKDFQIFNCDFRDIGDRVKTGSVDLAIVDPPWSEWRTLGRPLGEQLHRILRPNGFACVYTGVYWEDEWNDALKNAGLRKTWRAIALHRSPGSILYFGPICHKYTSILIYRNDPTPGTWKSRKVLNDVLESQSAEKELHDWQQPVGESVTLIECLSQPNDLICDLCVGSGTVPTAAALVGEGRRFLGCEINPVLVPPALARVAEVLRR
jgi:ParB-like chromosome segregation protein Spo0J